MSSSKMEDLISQLNASTGGQATTAATIKTLLPFLIKEGEEYFKIVDEVVEQFGPEIAEYIERIVKYSVHLDITAIKAYTDGGLTQEQAIELVKARRQSAASMVKNFSK